MLKVAEYCATLEKYEKAIKIYETVAAASLESQLLKYAAKDQFFRASLCHLCIDALNAQHAVTKYEAGGCFAEMWGRRKDIFSFIPFSLQNIHL